MECDCGLNCVVAAVAASPTVAEKLVMLHVGGGVFHAGPHASVLRVVCFLAGQEWAVLM